MSKQQDRKSDAAQPSRRQLLSQGANVSLGLIFLPQFLSGQRQPLARHSLLALATTAAKGNDSKAVGPITVTIHFTAKAGKIDALTTHLIQAMPDARKAKGCRYAQLYQIADAPNRVVLFKGWDNDEAQTKYLQWEQSSGRLSELLAMVEGEPMVEYWEFQQH